MPPPQSRAADSHHDEYERDEDDSGDAQEPLLPRFRFATASEGNKARRRRRWAERAALLASGALVVVGLVTVSAWMLSGGQRAGLAAAQVAPPSDGPASLATSSPPSRPSFAQQFLHNASFVNEGVVPFPSSLYSPVYRPRPLEHTLTTLSFASSPRCLERYIATGEVCSSFNGRWADEATRPKVDAIWTWVNGSSAELLTRWREAAAAEETRGRGRRLRRWLGRKVGALRRRLGEAAVARHFREHDELRFSVRSVLQSLGSATLSTLHLVVGDSPLCSPADRLLVDSGVPPLRGQQSVRAAQIPQWLDLPSVEFSEPSLGSPAQSPRLLVHPHSEVFKAGSTGDEVEARSWLQRVTPSFNSLAIESQLANIPSTAQVAVYLNDDFFLHRPFALADMASPLSGPVLRLQRDLLVRGVPPDDTHDDPEGEWRGLGYSAFLLDERFGKRARPYLVHVAKTVSLPVLREAQQVFLDALTRTAESRFRGRGPSEVQTLFLVSHYTIEKHREALLWSFLVARCDTDRSATYVSDERRALLAALGYNFDSPDADRRLVVNRPSRRSLLSLAEQHARVGLPNPRETTLDFSSHDGYAFFGLEGTGDIPVQPIWPSFRSDTTRAMSSSDPAPAVCTFDLTTCFGDAFLSPASDSVISVSETLARVAYKYPQCGDCLITLLVGKSGAAGLEAFLPADVDKEADEGRWDAELEASVQAVGLEETSWQAIDFSRGLEGTTGPSLRAKCAALIHRYSYTLGSSPAAFEAIRSGGDSLSSKLGGIDAAFVALNDDVASSSEGVLEDVDARMGAWFEKTWPVASPWERAEET
ncbi:hypothetical protein DMC30DRAFT_357508 [Rhodotorula diobovata]|uniref:Stealth protein CR3 conserved region 3 domain-containing protein n=1 Tax=Rhodotorula diobovata TaxID=5288 RepID=A0A5C5FKA0_9BASI|nr:hypothetical protein DMC30DRAFT_357508 [Rhodotorula diobovata]